MQFLKMAWLDFKGHRSAFNFEEFITLEALYPFLTLVFYCVTAGYAHQSADVTSWVVGNAFLLCTNICVFTLGNSFTGERYFGRIRSIMVSNLSKIIIILQKGFFSVFFSVATTLIGFAMGCVVFGIEVMNIPWGDLMAVFSVGMFAAVGFGMFLAVFGLVSDQMHFILNLMQYVLLIFSGANFPITQLPVWCQKISYILPLTRSIENARRIMEQKAEVLEKGQLLSNMQWQLLGEELLVGVVYIILAAAIVKGVERLAIRKGTFDLF